VRDNAGIYTSKVVQAARLGRAKSGIYRYYRPPYSPERNRIEPVFKPIKYHEMPTRSHTSKAERRPSVEAGSDTYRQHLHQLGEKLRARAASTR